MSWYDKDTGEPKIVYSRAIEQLTQYFEASDNGAGWYECAKLRIMYGDKYRKWVLFFLWWFYYKWKDPHRELYEKTKKKKEAEHLERVSAYRNKRSQIHKRAKQLVNELLPILDKFSTKHYQYGSSAFCQTYSIEDIKNFEKL